MGEWRETTFTNICDDICYGYTASANSNPVGPKFLRITDIAKGRLNWDEVPFCKINRSDREKYSLKVGDIVVARTGATTGANHTIIERDEAEAVFASYLIRYRIDTNLAVPSFVGFQLKSPKWRSYVDGIAGGSAQPGANAKQLGDFILTLPQCLKEQKAIAEVLASLDDKIDLLDRQNKTLEALAETLFRHTFIDNARNDWAQGHLPDEFDFTMGLSPPGSSYNEDREGMPMFQGNADFGFRFPENRVFTIDPKRTAKAFDTLISVRAPVGAQNMASETCCIGRGVAAFRYRPNEDFCTYTYFKLRSLMQEIQSYNDTGTVFGSISKKDLEKIEITIPSIGVIEEFEAEAGLLNGKVIKNCAQIISLKTLRDTLLPKLMSGAVRVKYDEAG